MASAITIVTKSSMPSVYHFDITDWRDQILIPPSSVGELTARGEALKIIREKVEGIPMLKQHGMAVSAKSNQELTWYGADAAFLFNLFRKGVLS